MLAGAPRRIDNVNSDGGVGPMAVRGRQEANAAQRAPPDIRRNPGRTVLQDRNAFARDCNTCPAEEALHTSGNVLHLPG